MTSKHVRACVQLARIATSLGLVGLVAAGCGRASSQPHLSDGAPRASVAGTSAGATAAGGTRAATWTTGPRLPVAVSEIGVALVNGQVHVVGGYVGGRAHSTTHLVYDIAARRWHTAAPMPAALDHVAAVAIGTGQSARLLAIGGYGTSGRPTSATYEYDGAKNAWHARASLPVARAAGVAVLANGLVHYIGGKAPGGDTGEHDVYDPAANRWSRAAPMPTPRDHAAAAVIGRTIYVAAGRPGSKQTLESYDVGARRWTTGLPALPLGRSSLAGAAWRGMFLVLGGEDASESTAYRNVDAYDPTRRKWTQLPAMPAGRQGMGAVVAGSTLLVPGGGPVGGATRQTDTLLELQ